MWRDLQRLRAARRLKAGDGRPIKRFRWWQTFTGRSLLHIELVDDGGHPVVYSVDVKHGSSDEDGYVVANLYRDGLRHARSRVPAAFPVEGGVIEVATTSFGLKRCHYVTPDGVARQLVPDPRSAEGRRARIARERPVLSRSIGVVSVIALLVGVGLNLLQILEPISRVPPIAENIGVFESPIHLPLWLNIALGVAAALASTERALRLRYNWLLDAGGN